MANGVQLATAYISLNVRTDGIKKQIDSALRGAGSAQGRQLGTSIGTNIIGGIREHMSGGRIGAIFAPIAVTGVRWAAGAGKAIGTALRTAIVSSVSLGVGAALLGATAALTAGLDRLKTIQRAQVQLSLTLPPSEIKRVTKDIQDVVRGTPIALDEALQAVPRALSAGIKPGKELNQYIKNIADTAASTGGQAGFGQIDIIFSQILGKGKLMGEELMQLTENGVDLRNALKNTFNWDDKKLNSLVAKGKVGMKEIQQAVEQTWGKNGGLSKQMGNTFDGAMGNLKASVARLGANVLGLIFGDPNNPDDPLKGAIDGITSFTQKIDSMGKWVAEHREDIRGYFDGARDTASKLGDKVKDVVEWLKSSYSTVRDFGSKIAEGFTKGKDAVGELWNTAADKLGKIKSKIGEIVDDLKKKFDGIFGENGWFAQQFDKLANIVNKVRDVLGLGPATANAAAPGGSVGGVGGGAPFNPGPMAPGVAAGQLPLGGSTQGLSSVPAFGMDANGNPLTSTSGLGQFNPGPQAPGKSGLTVRMPTQSSIGAPIYSGDVTEDTGGAVEPRNALVQDLITQQFGADGATIGNDYRKPDGFNEHSSGQASDIMVSELGKRTDEGIALGNRINKWLLDHAEKIGLQYTIWNGMLYRPDGSTSPNRGNGPTLNHEDHVHYRVNPGKLEQLPQFASGGGIAGPGNGTSDSIPAMLSNGEHVLTAADVKKMGGQSGVYAFRQALQAGMIPGFAPGGAVDPNTVQDAQNNLGALNNAYAVATAQFNELMQNGDATPSQILQAQQNLGRTKRELDNASADFPLIASGMTPPDRSKQNKVYDVTDQLALLQQQLADQQDAGTEVPYSQQLQQNFQLESLKREREQAVADLTGQGAGQEKDYAGEFFRSMGYMPAAAGSTGVAGTSSLAQIIDMGNSVVSGLIDTGVNLGQMAVSAAISGAAAAGSFGAAAPAAPAASMAASYGLQLLGNQGKTISGYWFGLGGILADAVLAQANPFGMPRALGYDYTAFMPQLGIQQAATSTLEKMGSDAITKYFAENAPGGQKPVVPGMPAPPPAAASGPAPVVPDTPPGPQPLVPNQQILQPGDPGFYDPGVDLNNPLFNPNGAGGAGGGGSWAKGGHVGIYDQGGILKPGTLALNASTRPEKVLTEKQWQAMTNVKPAGRDAPLVKIDTIYGMNPEDVAKQIESKQKLAMMRFSGRP